ncbi:hypothetical protein BKK79_20135 [Cupriavidus sp. USMAA2-4]|uniref:hypothetical protein n=1 Tax=Cupriavidus sp. USMAA2-4 TaxID=876364 RepID=UPI0008A6CE66|nr:hypothetical protein [Cupriavidus sp. USMAA2-4]AOY90409.1 hypothetical protein BKK79_00140 [Cupriavidus sp. USMAA2-4]AOY93855.1 hypothetical protein BKK79_20135 [Cupriavidus sp. USMAA2-4]
MGNPKLRPVDKSDSDSRGPSINPANGVLAYIPGDYVHVARQTLGPADSDNRTHAEVVIEAGNFGTVRIFFERKLSRHHKSYYHYWMAYRAEPVTPDTAHADADHA